MNQSDRPSTQSVIASILRFAGLRLSSRFPALLFIWLFMVSAAAVLPAQETLPVAGTAEQPAAAPLTREEVLDLFVKAKDFFNQANELYRQDPGSARTLYLKAALFFERIAEAGKIKNGKLFYNIGNCYYRVGDIGRAILNYRRAQQYVAQDPNLVQNLAVAREQRIDKIEPSTQSRILNILFFWHYDIPPLVRLILFSAGFILIWLLALLRFRLSRTGRTGNSGLKWGIVAATLVSALFFGSLLFELIDSARHRPGVVLAEKVVARKGNSETYQPSFQEPLHAGTEFELLEARGDWLQVKLDDGRTCWLPAADVELVR